MLHDAQIMGNHDVGKLKLLLQCLQKVDHLRLDRDIQGADGFVSDDQLWPHRQGPGNADSLPLTSRELVGVSRHVICLETHGTEEFSDPISPFRSSRQVVNPDRLTDDLLDAHPRVEGRVRVLKDHLDPGPKMSQFLAGHACNILSLKFYLPRGRIVKPDETSSHGRLPAAGLTHQSQRFSQRGA